MNLFRNLTKDEIEIRRGRRIGQTQNRCELLLYKTARTDMNLLDETFGNYGWACQYKEENGILFCGIALKDKDTDTWVWKWNAGSEGNFEKDKAVASDSFKRAGFLWGLGRELYTAPRVIVTPRNDWEQFYVDYIEYDEKDRICDLRIVNDSGQVVFNMQGDEVDAVDNVETLRAFCSDMKHQEGVDKKDLLKFFDFYKDKITSWNSVSLKTIEKLWDKWSTGH